MKISRRKFLKNSLVGSTAALVAGSNVANATDLFSPVEKIPHASHIGAFYAHVRDGKIIDITPQESDARPNGLIKSLIDRTYSNTRIKYPMVRRSYLEGKKNNQKLRGRDEFVRISWDEALKLVADKIKETPKENIYNGAFDGWGHPGKLNFNISLLGRFFNVTKKGAIGTGGDYSTGAASLINPEIIGDIEVYSEQTTHEQILENAEVYVMWGADIYKDNKIDYDVPNHKNDLYFKEYKKSGIKFISIDPIITESAKMLDAECIQIRPNTDVAMILSMIYHLYTTNKHDKKFIEKYTYGFDKFIPYVLGKTDGIKKTPEWAEKITEVSASKIKELAELFVAKKTFIAGNWAMQRAHHGEQAHWAIISLAATIGKIGLPGQGIGLGMHQSGAGQPWSGNEPITGLPQGRNRVKDLIPASRITDALNNPGKAFTYNGEKHKYPNVKLMYSLGINFASHHQDTNELINILRNGSLETLISQDPWWTATSKMADIVLPACTTLERDDLTGGGSTTQDIIYAMKKAIEPLHESKSDYDIFYELTKLFGDKAHKKFTKEKTAMEHVKTFYMRSSGPKLKDFDKFWKDGYVQFETPKENYGFSRHAEFRKDPEKNKLATTTGKIQFFSDLYASYKYDDFKGHVTWFEPAEYLGSKEAKEFPLHLVSPHPTYRVHSQLDNTWIRQVHKVQGREPIRINPKDAKKYGIQNGDVVEAYNKRGRILVGAVVTDDIREGVVAIEEGCWYSPEDSSEKNTRCTSGLVNVLTSARPSSSMASSSSANTCLIAIKKANKVTANKAYLQPRFYQS